MEESSNRKLRLKAMRMEAAEVEASSSNTNTSMVSTHLCNPLAEPSVHESIPIATRFDYYTDPMAAYSGNKRKTQKTNENYFSPPTSSAPPGPGNFNTMPPSPCQQYNQTQIHSSDQGMCRSPLPYNNSAPWGSQPRQFAQQHGPPPILNRPGGPPMYGIPPNSPIVGPNTPMLGGYPSPCFGGGGSPNPYGYQLNNTPSPGFGPGHSPNPNGHQFTNTPNPGFGRGASPSPNGSPYHNGGRGGRGQYNNPNFGYARGGSPGPRPCFNGGPRYNNNGPGNGYGRGRGRGFHESVSARERPDLFYNKSMLEDPWKYLKPVVRKADSWLPKSIRKEKAPEMVVATTGSSRSGFSFAESLAASFEEAAALAAAYEKTPEIENDLDNV